MSGLGALDHGIYVALDPHLADCVVAAGRAKRLWIGGVWTGGPAGLDNRGYLVWSDIANGDMCFANWPHCPARHLTKVGLIARGLGAEIQRHDGIRFDCGEGLTAFGLWVDFGSWPQDRPVHQIAVVPATAMVDDLAQAERPGQLRWRLPVVEKGWSVRVPPTDGSVVKGALS